MNNSLGILPMQVVLGLASVPSIAGAIALRVALHHLERLGVGSEEVFRGERLPALPFPDKS
jgi:hypothetical protein